MLDEHGVKLLRYCGVSILNTIFGLSLLVIFHDGLGWNGARANFAAVAINTIPAYFMARIWVWEQDGKSDFGTEVVPFWALAFMGLFFSTALVGWSDRRFDGFYVVYLANITAFLGVWALRYLVFEHIVWADDETGPAFPDCIDEFA